MSGVQWDVFLALRLLPASSQVVRLLKCSLGGLYSLVLKSTDSFCELISVH